MNQLLALMLAALFTKASLAADAGCHLRTRAAIGCASADMAALAYEKFGFNAAASGKSNIQALLHQAQCLSAGDGYKSVKLLAFENGNGRVPTAHGWVDVLFLDVDNGKYPLYFAAKYVEGACEKFHPTTIQGN
ncbi:hypothetical protein NUJ30_08220 [Burkholderia contaminans]|nr:MULTISPECIES: hypothetical protein [Burkholderia]MBD1412900.1 hypothetical protein [Burkholderia contaminans]UXZ76412.1 hypothetical protein NUJ30_08220 [Burkholderia contaminans]